MKFSLNPATESALSVRRTYGVSKDKVFKEWKDARTVAKWWCPEGLTLKRTEWSPKPGNAFRFEYQAPNGDVSAAHGEFQDASPDMLIFSWAREGKKADIGGTLVTIEFRPVAKGCEIALTHELLPNGTARDAARSEWLARFERLSRILGA